MNDNVSPEVVLGCDLRLLSLMLRRRRAGMSLNIKGEFLFSVPELEEAYEALEEASEGTETETVIASLPEGLRSQFVAIEMAPESPGNEVQNSTGRQPEIPPRPFRFKEPTRAYLHGCGISDDQIDMAEKWQQRGTHGYFEEMMAWGLKLEVPPVPTQGRK